jgi:hypothetical protein
MLFSSVLFLDIGARNKTRAAHPRLFYAGKTLLLLVFTTAVRVVACFHQTGVVRSLDPLENGD